MRSVSVSEMSGLSSGCQRSLHLIRDSSLCFVSLALPDSARLVKCSSKQIPAEHWGGGGGTWQEVTRTLQLQGCPSLLRRTSPVVLLSQSEDHVDTSHTKIQMTSFISIQRWNQTKAQPQSLFSLDACGLVHFAWELHRVGSFTAPVTETRWRFQ